jgi:hypothetical protein
MNSTKGTIVLVTLAALVAVIPAASATCSNASIKGVYGILSSGLNGSLSPAASINRVVADGLGNATGTATKSIDGAIVTYSFTGKYSIASNCTGTATWTNQSASVEHDKLFLNNGNNGAFLIQTDANHVQSAFAVAEGAATCTNLGVKHIYSMEMTGNVISTGQVAMAGQLNLGGAGTLKGTVTMSLGGTIYSSVASTGTYQINSDCTGTAKITPTGHPTINLALMVVNADAEIMAVETDSNTIVSGTLQQ